MWNWKHFKPSIARQFKKKRYHPTDLLPLAPEWGHSRLERKGQCLSSLFRGFCRLVVPGKTISTSTIIPENWGGEQVCIRGHEVYFQAIDSWVNLEEQTIKK